MESLRAGSLERFLTAKEIAVVLFYAQWEFYHPTLRNLFEVAIEEFGDEVNFGAVDVDECKDLALRMKIRNVLSERCSRL